MKKLLLISVLLMSSKLFAAPGDTTWIYANNVSLSYYNNYDTIVKFPNDSLTYRKIYEIFTLGEYPCAPSAIYCHQWDYTVTNYLLTATDTFELSRFITPYANTGVPRFPSTWKQQYIFDVTDFYPYLRDSAKVRILYSGYSGGFTANVKFAFIEGTPERNVEGIDPLWMGTYTYGNPSDPIANHIAQRYRSVPVNTQTSALKFTVTGHGSDNTTQCCEFSAHNYYVYLDSGIIASKTIWRDDCGWNELYPQGGTWIYNRGNWCPGDAVFPNEHILPGIVAGNNYYLGLGYDYYTTTGSYGVYDMEGHVVYYGGYNHSLDASLDNIIAPNNFADYFRENPSGIYPIVKVHNAGAITITSLTFSYGVKDSVPVQWTWHGSLLRDKDTIITLDTLNTLARMSRSGSSGVYTFVAKITSVNGSSDEDTTNNKLTSTFIVAPMWPSSFFVNLRTNNEGVNSLGVSPSETSWQITDMNNNVLASRTNANVTNVYKDTVTLPPYGFYRLTISDGGCDGLQWWVWTQNPSYGVSSGAFGITKLSGVVINMNGYNYSGTFNNDFGCGFSQYFTTGGSTAGIHNFASFNINPGMVAFPNPAQDKINIIISGIESISGQFQLIDNIGKIVLQQKASGVDNLIDLKTVPNGIYTVTYRDSKVPQLQTRIVVVK